jgi:hypothetical protein
VKLTLTRAQILAFRRRAGALEERIPWGEDSLRRAAWAGLQDSMPRAALLSLYARLDGAEPTALDDPTLVQLWGPRFQVYVISADSLPAFSLGRLPDDAKGRDRAEHVAARLHADLKGERRSYADAGLALGIHPNSLRYGAATGTILIRWEGARAPKVWTVPRPEVDPLDARRDLVRRYLHVFGPSTPAAFTRWAGMGSREASAAFDSLAASLTMVGTPVGDAWILAEDEPELRADPRPPAPARLLPSGDAYYLLWGADRELLIADAARRDELWTPRVWPGAVLVDGEIRGTWRRAGARVDVQTWEPPSPGARAAVEAEAAGFPLPGIQGAIGVRWDS